MDEAETEQEFEVWFDNWPAIALFLACNTQWQMGEGGPVGLRYEILPMMFKLYRVRKKDRPDMLTDLKTCERAALDAWSQNRDR